MWLINVYLSRGTKQQIQELLLNINRYIPQEDLRCLVILGDFNINLRQQSDRLDTLRALTKDLGLSIIEPSNPTRNEATLDFIICNPGNIVKTICINPNLSDHSALRIVLSTPQVQRIPNIKVINREIAHLATIEALQCSSNSEEFLKSISKFRESNKDKLYKILNRRQINRKLFLVLVKEKETETKVILNKYWEDLIKENEKLRYSICSKEAFAFLKKVYKYNLFEKRDGSIDTKILVDDLIITNEQDVHKHIINALKSIKVNEKFPKYDQPKPFPVLANLTDNELDDLIGRLWSGKAITIDCVTDDIFKKEFREKVQLIFRDLWNGQNINEYHFHIRIVPLNKMHPKVPNPTQIRPIAINSAVVKL